MVDPGEPLRHGGKPLVLHSGAVARLPDGVTGEYSRHAAAAACGPGLPRVDDRISISVAAQGPHPSQALPFLDLLVKGPIIIFILATAAAIVAFGYANSRSRPTGVTPMTLDELSTIITACLGVLTVTTNAVVSYLFNASGGEP
jgi:hypothetical protein